MEPLRRRAARPGAPSLAGARRGEHACPHMCVPGASQPGCAFVETPSEPRSRPHEQSGLGCSPFPWGFCWGVPCPSREGAWGSLRLWWPLSLFPAPWKPRGKVEGQVCSSPWKVWSSECCTALCRQLINSAAPPAPSHGPPGTDKRQNMPCGQQVWEQRRVPRGGGSVGRAGTAAPAVACPSPAPGHVCLSRGGGVWGCLHRGRAGTSDTRPPRAAWCHCPASLQCHANFRC